MAIEPLVLFLKGIVVGLCASAPLGPIGVVCVQRTLNRGRWVGFASGYGAALADTLFAIIAAFGVGIILKFLEDYHTPIVIGAGIVVLILGWVTYRRNPLHELRKARRGVKASYIKESLYVMSLTLTNPLSILLFISFFALFKATPAKGAPLQFILLITGVHLGAILWWLALSGTVNHFRKRIRLRSIVRFNSIGGLVIMGLGLIMTAYALMQYYMA